ncbi:ABC transporter permease [Spirochaeta dissipatitropha]
MGRRNALGFLRMNISRRAPHLTGALFLFLLVPPLLAVLGAGVADTWYRGGSSALIELLSQLRRPAVLGSIRFSLIQAAASAVISVLLALPGAWFLSHSSFPGKRAIQSLTLLPFVLPSLIIVLAIISMYGRAGFLSRLFSADISLVYSPFGIILAHVLFNISVALRMISSGWLAVDRRYIEVSRSLGESTAVRLLRIDLPLLMPSIVSALSIIFLYCFVSFGIVLIFGGVRYSTLEVRIYQEMFQGLNLGGAALLSLVQILITGLVLFILQFAGRYHLQPRGRRFLVRSWEQLGSGLRISCISYWAFIGTVFFSPLLTLLIRAFRPGGSWSLAAFRALLGGGRLGDRDLAEIMRASPAELFVNSLLLASAAALLCCLLAYTAARLMRGRSSRTLDAALMLPLAISSVTFSLGMRIIWLGRMPEFAIIALTQSVMGFPMVFRLFRTALEDFPRNYTEAAQSVGAGWLFRLFTLDIPVLRRSLVNGYILAFALSLADFTAVLTIARGNLVTFPVALYRLIGFQSFDAALALGVLYIVIVLLCFWGIDVSSYRREEQGL